MLHQSFPATTPVYWGDRVTYARSNPDLAIAHIEAVRDEALTEADKPQGREDRAILKAIAQAAQSFIDCPCDDCLDELDALICGEPDDYRFPRREWVEAAAMGRL